MSHARIRGTRSGHLRAEWWRRYASESSSRGSSCSRAADDGITNRYLRALHVERGTEDIFKEAYRVHGPDAIDELAAKEEAYCRSIEAFITETCTRPCCKVREGQRRSEAAHGQAAENAEA